MRPGETNLMTINYATWSVPIGSPGLVNGFDYTIEADASACSTAPVDGFVPPSNVPLSLTTPVGTDVEIDLTDGASPAGNTFTFAPIPMNGPEHGSIVRTAEGIYDYTPATGYVGWDHVWFVTTDAQGRSVVSSVVIKVGDALGAAPAQWTALKPYIDRSRVMINAPMHTVSFPIFMTPACRACDSYRLTIRQPAQDCDRNTYVHLSCFEIRCKDCG